MCRRDRVKLALSYLDIRPSIRAGLCELAPIVRLQARNELVSSGPVRLECRRFPFLHLEPVFAKGIEDVGPVGPDIRQECWHVCYEDFDIIAAAPIALNLRGKFFEYGM